MFEELNERFSLVAERVENIKNESTVDDRYRDFFTKTAEYIAFVNEVLELVQSGKYENLSMDELKAINDRNYGEIRPENYVKSYANPA